MVHATLANRVSPLSACVLACLCALAGCALFSRHLREDAINDAAQTVQSKGLANGPAPTFKGRGPIRLAAAQQSQAPRLLADESRVVPASLSMPLAESTRPADNGEPQAADTNSSSSRPAVRFPLFQRGPRPPASGFKKPPTIRFRNVTENADVNPAAPPSPDPIDATPPLPPPRPFHSFVQPNAERQTLRFNPAGREDSMRLSQRREPAAGPAFPHFYQSTAPGQDAPASESGRGQYGYHELHKRRLEELGARVPQGEATWDAAERPFDGLFDVRNSQWSDWIGFELTSPPASSSDFSLDAAQDGAGAELLPEPFSSRGPNPAGPVARTIQRLERRLAELETSRIAHEDATRTVIDQTFSQRGSNINDFVVFGGTLEVLTGWADDFDGQSESLIQLNTAELDFEIQVNNWTTGVLVLEYADGTNFLFPTTEGDEQFVDRFNVDEAYVYIGDTQRFWPYGKFGRMVLPFGISTGDPVADVLTLEDPLTIEVFESKEDAILIGFEFPTPKPTPAVPPPTPPPVRPLIVNPIFSKLSRCLGYKPVPPPPAGTLTPALPTPTLPPFTGAIYFYNGETRDRGGDHIEHIGGSLGYRTKGYSTHKVPILFPCPCSPWSLEVGVDVNSSIFDTSFLEFEYRSFLDQIGYVPGMAAHVRSTLGPVSLVVEWNAAINDATFVDDLDQNVRIRPAAWQVSLGYQFDWNPSVLVIGAQGTYFAISYSESEDLAGVNRVIDGEAFRIGFVPKKRFLVSMGEWVLDGLRVAVEYSHIVDYSEREGGTGSSARGVFGMLTYEW